MILEKQTEAHVLSDGEQSDSIKMSLDLDSAQILMQMLSKNLYSDAIGSTIRECASNALDSHRKAKETKPILVTLKKNKESNFDFIVEDFGVGLGKEDVKNIISKYGKSTKRESATELGMMGLGFKSPLAYSSSFYFICRKDGFEGKYMMYEGEDGNTIDTLYETTTAEPNGVKIIVPVKWNDRWDFVRKIKEQLAYFENVYFDVYSGEIQNDFKIHRSDVFQYSELSQDDHLHICLDNVYYPIDFIKLGIDPLNYNMGLRFGLTDGLFPTPNREALRYTQESKKIILDKIKEFSINMVKRYNKNNGEDFDINKIFKYYANKQRIILIENKEYDVAPLVRYSSISITTPKLKKVSLIDLKSIANQKDVLFQEYERKFTIRNDRFSQNIHYDKYVYLQGFSKNYITYFFDETIGMKKKQYLKSIHKNTSRVNFIKKIRSFKLLPTKGYRNDTNYFKILNLSQHPKSEWRERIKELQYIISLFITPLQKVEDVVIPQDWIDARKKTYSYVKPIKGEKLAGNVSCKIAEDLSKYVHGKNAKFVLQNLELEKIHKRKSLNVYAPYDDQLKLDVLFMPFGQQKVNFIAFSQREMKRFADIKIHNLIPLETFMEGKTKPFKRLVTAYLISNLIQSYSNVFSKKSKLIPITEVLYTKILLLETYSNKHYSRYNNSSVTLDTLVAVAEKYKLYDYEIYSVYLEVKAILEKLSFIDPIMGTLNRYSDNTEPLTDALIDLFKYYKHKIDYKCYNLKLNEDLPLDDVLTEDAVEDLTSTQ